MAQKAIGQVQGGNALAGPLDGANAELEGFQRTCSLLPAAVLRVFHETNTIFRNTRPVPDAADKHGPPRAMSFRPPKPFSKRPRRRPPAVAHYRLWRRSPLRRSVYPHKLFHALEHDVFPLGHGKLKESRPASREPASPEAVLSGTIASSTR
jgi:hypothetical protein